MLLKDLTFTIFIKTYGHKHRTRAPFKGYVSEEPLNLSFISLILNLLWSAHPGWGSLSTRGTDWSLPPFSES